MPVKSKPSTTELGADSPDILLVQDDSLLRELLAESLQQDGFIAITAGNGAEALRLARDRTPRLIVLDLDLPLMNGWQFLELRRQDRIVRKIPLIALGPLPADGARAQGADAHLPKPVQRPQLMSIIREMLSDAPSADLELTRPTPMVLVVDDDPDTRTAVLELLEENGYQVMQAANGEEAENLLRGASRPDCILLDLWMPVMNGWTFLDRLRDSGSPAIPIVVFTAAEPYWGYPVPFTQVLRKPFQSGSLLSMIRKVMPKAVEPALAAGAVRSRGPARTGND
jgi:CheY-like chemotaxis protein